MRRIFIVLAASVAFFCSGAALFHAGSASAKPDVPSYYGTWSAPDCGNFGEVLIFTKNYALRASEATSAFSPFRVVERRKDYDVVSFMGATHPVTRTEDGLLKVGEMDEAAKEWPQTWDELSLAGHSEYSHCHAVPPVVPVPLARVMEKIEGVGDDCAAAVTPACRKALFAVADSNGNKKLSPAEFKKLGALLGTFVPLVPGRAVTMADLEAAYRQGVADGDRIGQALIAMNGGKDLDAAAAAKLTSALEDPVWKKAIEGLATLFPGLVKAAAAPAAVSMPKTGKLNQ
jgi:hypothetical protein